MAAPDDSREPTTGKLPRRAYGKRKVISQQSREVIAQRVNGNAESLCSVAKDLQMVSATVYRIAAAARGIARPTRAIVKPGDALGNLNDGVMPPDPFDGAKINLCGKKLSIEEKTYLAALVNIKREPAAKVGRDYGLSRSFVGIYANRMRKGNPIVGRQGGINAVIDDESDVILKSLASKASGERPSLTEMRVHLQEQINWTHHRRESKKRRLCLETAASHDTDIIAKDEAPDAGDLGSHGKASGTPYKYVVKNKTFVAWLQKYGYRTRAARSPSPCL